MDRRTFLAGAVGSLVAPLAAEGQRAGTLPRLCFLTLEPGTVQAPSPRFEAFFQGLRDLGYIAGQTIAIDYLSAGGRTERFAALAAECVRLKSDVIASSTTPGAQAAKRATQTVPIVMLALGDPVATGLVDSLARPGGNVTGVSSMTSGIAAKRLQLLKEIARECRGYWCWRTSSTPSLPCRCRHFRRWPHRLGSHSTSATCGLLPTCPRRSTRQRESALTGFSRRPGASFSLNGRASSNSPPAIGGRRSTPLRYSPPTVMA